MNQNTPVQTVLKHQAKFDALFSDYLKTCEELVKLQRKHNETIEVLKGLLQEHGHEEYRGLPDAGNPPMDNAHNRLIHRARKLMTN